MRIRSKDLTSDGSNLSILPGAKANGGMSVARFWSTPRRSRRTELDARLSEMTLAIASGAAAFDQVAARLARLETRDSSAANAAFVRDLYLGILRREAREDELRNHVEALTAGALDRRQVIEAAIASEEFLALQHPSGPPAEPPRPERAYERCGSLPSEGEAVFRQYQKYSGPGSKGYLTNFLGGLTSIAVDDVIVKLHPGTLDSGEVEDYPIYGNFQGDALEWVGVLRAVLEADAAFTMIELGAGWAPWCAVGFGAAKQRGFAGINVIAVEADAGHAQFARENFSVNGIPDTNAQIHHGAVGPADGTARFPQARTPSAVYGGVAHWFGHEASAQEFQKLMEWDPASTVFANVEEVPCYSLATLSQHYDVIDLIHCDIQGSEAMLFSSAIDLVSTKVKRVVIGTHSIAIDRALVNIFGKAGWELEGMHACVMREEGGHPVLYVDGTQVWRNSRFD